MKNPFLTYGYNGPEYFCDRVEETKRLTSLLVTSQNVITHGLSSRDPSAT